MEFNIYHGLRDVVNNWFGSVDSQSSPDASLLKLKGMLIKWQGETQKNVAADMKDLFDKGVQAGIAKTGIAVDDSIYNSVDYMTYKSTGIAPAIENFRENVYDNIAGIVRKHYKDGNLPLYTSKRSIDSFLRKSRYKTRLMMKTAANSYANYGQLLAWEKDPDKYFFNYFWNAMSDERSKPISKMRAEGSPYSASEIQFLFTHQKQYIGDRWQDDTFNNRCSISRGDRLENEWKDNRFSGQEDNFAKTL